MILVSVVLAVLVAVAIPGFSKTSQRMRAEQAAFDITQLFRYARSIAVTQQATVGCAWDEELRRVYLEQLVEDVWVRMSGSHVQSSTVPSAIDVSMLVEGAPAERVRFFADGTSENAALLVSHRGHLYTVAIHATTGQARITTETQAF